MIKQIVNKAILSHLRVPGIMMTQRKVETNSLIVKPTQKSFFKWLKLSLSRIKGIQSTLNR